MSSSAVNRDLSIALALSWSLCLTVAAPVLAQPAAPLSPPCESSPSGSVTTERAKTPRHQLPLSFEANHGQSDPTVKFLARGPGYTLFLTATEAVAALPDTVVRMQLLDANRSPEVLGLEPLPGRIHYFRSNDPRRWLTNIPLYAKVKVGQIYPGIDLVYYADHRQLEYDFVIAPGKNPAVIELGFQGADDVELTTDGTLVVHTPRGELRLRTPLVYQERAGARHVIPSHYVFLPRATEGAERVHRVGIQVGAYDMRYPLVIDPVLSYSTYLGGARDERGTGIAVDATGAMYVTGETSSPDFPTQNPLQPLRGAMDAFVTKLTPDGSALVYSTYLGGSAVDPVVDPAEPGPVSRGFGIAVDAAGAAYVTGETTSADFPTMNPFQAALRGRANAFVAKLAADGSALVYSTYLGGTTRTLGGSGLDSGRAIAVDAAGAAYVAGDTSSADFPTKNPLKPASRFGALDPSDAFVTKLAPDGSTLLYSTYLGGSGAERAFGIAVDASGAAYVTGETRSTNFPAPGVQASGFQPMCAVDLRNVCADAFVAKIDPSQVGTASLVYSTYLGGANFDAGRGIAVDGTGAAYVTGYTVSRDFPLTANPAQATFNGCADAFVTKLTPDGSALVSSTYLGGSDADRGFGIAVDAAGAAYVTGETASSDFPTASAVQATLGGGMDAFVTKIDPSQSGAAALVYSTYLGGSGADRGFGIAVDTTGAAYVTGRTRSTDFPAINALQPTLGGGADAFITKIGP